MHDIRGQISLWRPTVQHWPTRGTGLGRTEQLCDQPQGLLGAPALEQPAPAALLWPRLRQEGVPGAGGGGNLQLVPPRCKSCDKTLSYNNDNYYHNI